MLSHLPKKVLLLLFIVIGSTRHCDMEIMLKSSVTLFE